MRTIAPSNPRDRFEVYRFFNGLSSEAKEGLDQRRLRVPLVKTFLLEHVACRGNGRPKPPSRIFENLGAVVRPIDDRFMGLDFKVLDPDTKSALSVTTGFLEQYDERFLHITPARTLPRPGSVWQNGFRHLIWIIRGSAVLFFKSYGTRMFLKGAMNGLESSCSGMRVFLICLKTSLRPKRFPMKLHLKI